MLQLTARILPRLMAKIPQLMARMPRLTKTAFTTFLLLRQCVRRAHLLLLLLLVETFLHRLQEHQAIALNL
jgi:hypothetical protein